MSDYLSSIAGNSAATATKKPEELNNPVLSLGQDPKKATGHVAGDEKSWLDAYGQNEQKSWQDYYGQYKDLFSGDKPGGYGSHAASRGDDSQANMRYMMNLQQRQMDERMTEYQDWQQKYWDQQNAQNEELMKWLRGEQEGQQQPEMEWWQDENFQKIAGEYAHLDPRWLNWSQGHDREGMESSVGSLLSSYYAMTPEERKNVPWAAQLMYLVRHLGIQYDASGGQQPQPEQQPWYRTDPRMAQIGAYAAQTGGGWDAQGWAKSEDELRQSTSSTLSGISQKTMAEWDEIGRSLGVSGQQWVNDMNWLATRLGLSPVSPRPEQQPQPEQQPWYRTDPRMAQIGAYAANTGGGWDTYGWTRSEADLRNSVSSSLYGITQQTWSDLNALGLQAGIDARQWVNDMNWLASRLGLSPVWPRG